jgi:hypothetical protein
MTPIPDDDLLEAAIRGSLGGRLASAVTGALARAAASSVSFRVGGPVVADWRALARTERLRLIALLGAIAMLVNRGMARLGPAEPYSGILPWVIFAACAATAAFAAPLVRRWERVTR